MLQIAEDNFKNCQKTYFFEGNVEFIALASLKMYEDVQNLFKENGGRDSVPIPITPALFSNHMKTFYSLYGLIQF